MTSAIDIKRYRTRAMVRSFWKFFHFVNQFPRPARKNGHPVLSSRFLSRIFVITISSHLKSCEKRFYIRNLPGSHIYTAVFLLEKELFKFQSSRAVHLSSHIVRSVSSPHYKQTSTQEPIKMLHFANDCLAM